LSKDRKAKDKIYDLQNNIANVFKVKGQFDTAIVLYNKVLKYYESNNDAVKIGQAFANIGALYYSAGNYDKTKEYTLKALKMQRVSKDIEGTGVSLYNLSSLAADKKQFQEGIKYGEEALQIFKNLNFNYYAGTLMKVGVCYFNTNQKEKAIQYAYEAIDIYKKNNNISGLMESYGMLAEYFIDMKQYTKAKHYALQGLQVGDTTNRDNFRSLNFVLAKASIYLNEPLNAIHYVEEHTRLLEESSNKGWAEKIAEADARYQSEKKEKQILKLQNEKEITSLVIKRRNLAIYALIISITFLFGISFFIYRNVRSKRTIVEKENEIQRHKIRELENEKMLLATQSVLQGEETERKRLARDLHDGLGGLLSGAKIAFNNMKGNVILDSENVGVFNHALGLLDTSITELRRVAHNMMPEALIKLGLQNALSDFCFELNKANPINIAFQFYGQFERIDSNLEINAYRIIQELVNNAIKHSKAKELTVQMIQEKERLCFIVQDNGIGFDTTILDPSKGVGLTSVKSRIESFKGQMEIHSEPNNGTEITVEFAFPESNL
jgi:two-component system, NarL family, sensor kinase